MSYSANKLLVSKHYVRLVLALFVLSVLNLSVQIPAHAAMKANMLTMGLDMSGMNHEMGSMNSCHCPPSFCDSVLAVDNQTIDGLAISLAASPFIVNMVEQLDQNHGQLNLSQYFAFIQLSAVQSAPPPLLIKTLLLI